MRTRLLGRTELQLSEIALGTWGLAAQAYGPVEESDFVGTVSAALDLGITTFDMAPLWGDGRSEKVVAQVTESRRDELIYVTRAGTHLIEGEVIQRFDPKSLVQDCDASLERLRTDRIDLWLLHNPSEEVLGRHDYLAIVQQLEQQGKIRAWGASVGTLVEARMAITAGAEAICVLYNVFHSADLRSLQREVSVAGCGVLVRSPLSHGMLCGTWPEQRDFPPDDHRTSRWGPSALRQRVRQTASLRFLENEDVPSLRAAAIRFALQNEQVTSVLGGPRNPEQLGELVRDAACEPPYLNDEQLSRLEQVLATIGA